MNTTDNSTVSNDTLTFTANTVTATQGRYVRRVATGTTGRTMTLLPGDTPDSFTLTDSPETPDADAYARRVEAMIRERYTLSDELALLRQRDTKPGEFAAYNDYAEQCKVRARAAADDTNAMTQMQYENDMDNRDDCIGEG